MLTRQLTSQPTELANQYERDYYAWTDGQAHALRERKVSGLDWDNLAEEVEDLGKSERHRLESHLELLLMHLLKWVNQPHRRSRSWSNSIREHRFRIQRVLRDNPGLKATLPQIFADAYEAAQFSAENETRLDLSAFPESCPGAWTMRCAPTFGPEALRKKKNGGGQCDPARIGEACSEFSHTVNPRLWRPLTYLFARQMMILSKGANATQAHRDSVRRRPRL